MPAMKCIFLSLYYIHIDAYLRELTFGSTYFKDN